MEGKLSNIDPLQTFPFSPNVPKRRIFFFVEGLGGMGVRACVYVGQNSHSIVLCEGAAVVVRITTLSPHSVSCPWTHASKKEKKTP